MFFTSECSNLLQFLLIYLLFFLYLLVSFQCSFLFHKKCISPFSTSVLFFHRFSVILSTYPYCLFISNCAKSKNLHFPNYFIYKLVLFWHIVLYFISSQLSSYFVNFYNFHLLIRISCSNPADFVSILFLFLIFLLLFCKTLHFLLVSSIF